MSYGGCDIEKLLARGLAVRVCSAPTEEPNTGKEFYRCTAGHMHQAYTMALLDLHGPGCQYWSDGTRVLESFGLDPAFHQAFTRAWDAVVAQTGYDETDDPRCIDEGNRLFTAIMTTSGYGHVLDDSEEDSIARLNAEAAERERRGP